MTPTIEMLTAKGCRRITSSVWEYGPIGAAYTLVLDSASGRVRVLSPTGRWRSLGL